VLRPRIVGLVTVLAVAGVVAGGCGGQGVPRYGFGGPAIRVTTTTTEPLSTTVNGIPLMALAQDALGAAAGYSVNRAEDVRMVLTTAARLCHLMKDEGGTCTDTPEYLISLRGGFACGMSCGQDVGTNTTTASTSPPGSTTMYVAVPTFDSDEVLGEAVGVAGPNLSTLGRVYDLDPYVKALARTHVPIGPLPG
jgi:hypothetical protein